MAVFQIFVTRDNAFTKCHMHDAGAVKMQLRLPKPPMIDAGEYVNLRIPSVRQARMDGFHAQGQPAERD